MSKKSNAILGKSNAICPKSNAICPKSNAICEKSNAILKIATKNGKKKKQIRKKLYECQCCNYSTRVISNYKKHLNSKKHKRNESEYQVEKIEVVDNKILDEEKMTLIKQQEEEIKKLREKLNVKKIEHENELLNQKLGYCEKIIKTHEQYQGSVGMGNNNTINSNNTNNISINVFLNEKCKNAMNLTDFVNQIKVQLEDVMYTKLHGPEKGITNILVKQLEDVPITERPIHCADVKRKKFYIKDDDEWKKTQPSKEMNEISDGKGPIERCIRNLKSKQHLVMETEWKDKNPDHETNPEKKDEYLDIENKIWKGCAKGESWSDYMKKMEKDIAEWSLPTLKEEMKEELEDK